ncbi:MAG TPA: hypothetical protein VE219_05615 [Candidatus Sulfotelmatobacter sp.]|jgi:hypothetical protein|nr:hypothetical protein [Candidatus Sulfotelmatobacter sp.]
MTELLDEGLEVQLSDAGLPSTIRMPKSWRSPGRRKVRTVTSTWLVETDWWRDPVRRRYVRCLLGERECVEVYCDLLRGEWRLVRRYD